jgi:hypothetical protein
MVVSIAAPSHYEWQSHIYNGELRKMSDEELGQIVSDSKNYLDRAKGFSKFVEILSGYFDDKRAKHDVAKSLLEERTQRL